MFSLVQTHYLLADSLMQRVIDKKPFKMPVSEMVGSGAVDIDADIAQSADPRSLGFKSDAATFEMMRLKQLVVAAIDRRGRGAQRLNRRAERSDLLLEPSSAIFCSSVLPSGHDEVFEFLKAAAAFIETSRTIAFAAATSRRWPASWRAAVCYHRPRSAAKGSSSAIAEEYGQGF
jgi:hypothetical protein